MDVDSPVEVREARSADLGAVVAIENQSFDDPWNPATLLGELFPDPMRLPLVAVLDGVVCGYLMAWRMVDQLHILNIATARVQLRRGVGTALLREAARRAQADGLAEITLEVRRSNLPAIGFYRRHGFVEMGVRPRYYPDTGEDALIMTAACGEVLGGSP